MNNLFLLFTRPLERLGLQYMVSGSVAAIIYGEPRLTNDVDLILVLARADIPRLREAFSSTEFYCPPEEAIAVEAAREQRGHFNLIHIATGFKADLYLSGRDVLHAWALPRARKVKIEGAPMSVAPLEYVIVRKLEYFREGQSQKHIRDIKGMLENCGDQIDLTELARMIDERKLEEEWGEAKKVSL